MLGSLVGLGDLNPDYNTGCDPTAPPRDAEACATPPPDGFATAARALLAFVGLLLLLHFALFVRACVETSQHNHHRRACRHVVYVPVPVDMDGVPVRGVGVAGGGGEGGVPGANGSPQGFYGSGAGAGPQRVGSAGGLDASLFGYYAPQPQPPPGSSLATVRE